MNNMTKNELVKKIREMVNSTHDNIIKLIKDNKFIYSSDAIADRVWELRCNEDWADKPHSEFFRAFNTVKNCPNRVMKEIAEIVYDENAGYRDVDISKHFLSSQEHQDVIDKFDNELKKHEKKLKKQKKLYDLIEVKKRELRTLRNEYIKCGGRRYV